MRAATILILLIGSSMAEAVPEPAVRMEYIMPTDSTLRTRARAVPCYNKTQRGMGESVSEKDYATEPCVPSPQSTRREDRPDFEVDSPGLSAPTQTF